MKIDEIRALSSEELRKQLAESQRELLNLRFRMATRQLVNFREIRKVRKDIARIKTILRERELAEG
ncbi:MAG TPA: 50S ribosomal protein L29 [Dehalococcoidia bacterium]|jgi:large subunit ribosomal protein L29|nr:50S ribosomal protein L29 [Dehalococcoidia bacterium]